MGFHNPPVAWDDLRRRMVWGGAGLRPEPVGAEPPPPLPAPPPDPVPWAELHCHSSYSFLDGASDPAVLVAEAVRLGVGTLALTDHDGMYGLPKFEQAARAAGLATVFGAELGVGLVEQRGGATDPVGEHLLVLARDKEGYRRLSARIAAAHLAGGSKGRPRYDLDALADASMGGWAVLTGCRKGAVPAALASGGLDAAERALRSLTDRFGADHVYVELVDHDQPLDDARNDALFEVAQRVGVGVVASNNVHYAAPSQGRLAAAVAAVRARRSLDEMAGHLPSGSAHLRSGAEMAARLARFPGVRETTVELAAACAFDFRLLAPRLPAWQVPAGHDEASWLRELVEQEAPLRYGPRERERVPGAYEQIDRELAVITELGYAGYFLIVHDIVKFCQDNNILCQGRGSAANSAVCYALGITSVDAVRHGLLFARFLSAGRDGPPDIDVDIENRRREEVIQHVYRTYGRERAAQVANVISYRPRLALRDAARALGFSVGQQDAWSRQVDHHAVAPPADAGVPEAVLELAGWLSRAPRHLGIHSGGMVICDRPVSELCPVEWARMPGRSVVQWDKDDCAAQKLVKFDLLGLGMLAALHDALDLVARHHGDHFGLHSLPSEDKAVYAMLCDADSVGVFQVESRAQMATLPRLRPQSFYDLVVEVALIRPGPIQGGSVHPYLRRRRGEESVDIPHPSMAGALARTFGVPLFQEQMMRLAVDCAGFSDAEADQLRQAMGAKRAPERVERLRERLLSGMAERGIPPDVAVDVYDKLLGFANYGFPESHAISFAHLVYASAYLKRYYPAAFTAALLRNQPMGFYSPASLIADARRHGVVVRGVDVNVSAALADLEEPAAPPADAMRSPHAPSGPQPVIRLGLASVRRLGTSAAERVAAGAPYADLEDFVRRTALPTPSLEALALAGAFGCFGLGRRQALWTVGALAGARTDHLPGVVSGVRVPSLPAMSAVEETFADLWATGASATSHPVAHLRAELERRGALPTAALREAADGVVVLVGGLVTHRQQPPTAGGVVFLTVEDESGMVNVVCPPGVWERHRRVALQAQGLLVRGRLERADGATNLLAARLERLPVITTTRSRDFR